MAARPKANYEMDLWRVGMFIENQPATNKSRRDVIAAAIFFWGSVPEADLRFQRIWVLGLGVFRIWVLGFFFRCRMRSFLGSGFRGFSLRGSIGFSEDV